MSISNSSNETVCERSNLITSIINILPDKTKRWIFLTSFLALIQDKNDVDYKTDLELIKHLNEIFHISAQPRACLFSMKIKNFIWKDIPRKIKINNEEVSINELAKRNLSEKEIEIVSMFMKNIIPSWLKYDNDEYVIKNDVELLMKQIPSAT